MQVLVVDSYLLLWAAGLYIVAIVAALAVEQFLLYLMGKLAERTGRAFHRALVTRGRKPLKLLAPALALFLVTPELPLPAELMGTLLHGASLLLLGAAAWAAVALIYVVEDVISTRYSIAVLDNLGARRVQTQVRMLCRIATGAVMFFAATLMLMTFPTIRHLGLSLLASAGLAGVVVGMAARPAIGNLIAGVQVAFAQPIRIDDVVVVEGEWGRIEEIGTSYVVVRLWDMRHLILPLTYFIEHPFENWTRATADLLATVFIHADYSLPVQEVREELHRILEASDLWDRRVWGLQVTDATERGIQLRALMSAADSGRAWDLRCHVREQLVGFLQEHHPDSLPRLRAELSPAAPNAPSTVPTGGAPYR
jgi:small-conductance mechanosensitive channel